MPTTGFPWTAGRYVSPVGEFGGYVRVRYDEATTGYAYVSVPAEAQRWRWGDITLQEKVCAEFCDVISLDNGSFSSAVTEYRLNTPQRIDHATFTPGQRTYMNGYPLENFMRRNYGILVYLRLRHCHYPTQIAELAAEGYGPSRGGLAYGYG